MRKNAINLIIVTTTVAKTFKKVELECFGSLIIMRSLENLTSLIGSSKVLVTAP